MTSGWRSWTVAFAAFLTLTVYVALAPAAAQRTDTEAIYERFNKFYNANNYASALVEAKKYEAAVKASGTNNMDYAAGLNEVASMYRDHGKYADAERLFKHALAIHEKNHRANHPDVTWTLNKLADMYRELGKYTEAEVLYKRALEINEKSLEAGHPEKFLIFYMTGTLKNLADVYKLQGKYAEAERLHKRALEIKDIPTVPSISPERAYEAFKDFYAAGNYAEALVYARKYEALVQGNGANSEYAAALHNVALVYQAQGKLAEAEGLYKRALAINEKALGASHRSLAETSTTWPACTSRKASTLRRRDSSSVHGDL
jgi:tetratricopeptide (TPR) repeat protein